MPRIILAVFVAFGVAELAHRCRRDARAPPYTGFTIVAIADAPEAVRPAIETADEVFAEIRKAHVTEVTRAMATGGPERRHCRLPPVLGRGH